MRWEGDRVMVNGGISANAPTLKLLVFCKVDLYPQHRSHFLVREHCLNYDFYDLFDYYDSFSLVFTFDILPPLISLEDRNFFSP
jgi:hypothetical protein